VEQAQAGGVAQSAEEAIERRACAHTGKGHGRSVS
jgi:hypothetical protein